MVSTDQIPWSSADSHPHIQPLRTHLSVQKSFCLLLFFISDWAGKYLSQNTQCPWCTLKPKALKRRQKCQDLNNLTLSGRNQHAATLPVSPPPRQGSGCQQAARPCASCPSSGNAAGQSSGGKSERSETVCHPRGPFQPQTPASTRDQQALYLVTGD